MLTPAICHNPVDAGMDQPVGTGHEQGSLQPYADESLPHPGLHKRGLARTRLS